MTIKDMIEELEWYKKYRGSETDEVSFVCRPHDGSVFAKVENCSRSDHRHILFDEDCDIDIYSSIRAVT